MSRGVLHGDLATLTCETSDLGARSDGIALEEEGRVGNIEPRATLAHSGRQEHVL